MREGRFNLGFDLEAREQRHRIDIVLQFLQVLRHDLFDELDGFLVGRFVVDQDLAEIAGQVVAQRANH